MKKIACSVLIIFTFLAVVIAEAQVAPTPTPASLTTTPGSTAAKTQGRRKRVAVFDFDYATVATSSAALFGTQVDVGKVKVNFPWLDEAEIAALERIGTTRLLRDGEPLFEIGDPAG